MSVRMGTRLGPRRLIVGIVRVVDPRCIVVTFECGHEGASRVSLTAPVLGSPRYAHCALCLAAPPSAELFWSKVDRGGPDDCWPWRASLSTGGYGQVTDHRVGRPVAASRISWELANGPIPDGGHILHRCDNPPCVNQAHLFLGSHDDNMKDAWDKGRLTDLGALVTKLGPDQVREARALMQDGMSRAEAGRRFGVSPSLMSLIGRGERHREVPA